MKKYQLRKLIYKIHIIFICFYLKTFDESTKCQSWKVLNNELKIGTQISCTVPNFSFYLKTVSERTKCQSCKVLVNELKIVRNYVFCITMHQILAFYLKRFPDYTYIHFFHYCNLFHDYFFFFIWLRVKIYKYKIDRWNNKISINKHIFIS